MIKKKTISLFKKIWVFGGLIFTLWIFYSMQAKGVPKTYMLSDDQTLYENNDAYYSFEPRGNYAQTLVFYPGALVDPKAYIPLCKKIAENSIKVLLIKMPWRLSTQGYTLPIELNLLSDSTQTYILAGHSQGGKMAAQFVHENPGLVDQLILIGTTHPRDYSLANLSMPILKIFGSHDGVAPKDKIIINKSKLPKTTTYVEIKGGNHAQFGYYGFQLGDNRAGISREEQHQKVIKSIIEFVAN